MKVANRLTDGTAGRKSVYRLRIEQAPAKRKSEALLLEETCKVAMFLQEVKQLPQDMSGYWFHSA
jgi:hypothetical protein